MFVKRINVGCLYSKWYGFGWNDYLFNQSVCFLIPFHIPIRLIRTLYWKFLSGWPKCNAREKFELFVIRRTEQQLSREKHKTEQTLRKAKHLLELVRLHARPFIDGEHELMRQGGDAWWMDEGSS